MRQSRKLQKRTALCQRPMRDLRVIMQTHQFQTFLLPDQNLKKGIRPVTSLQLTVRPVRCDVSAVQCGTHGAGPHLAYLVCEVSWNRILCVVPVL